MKTLREAYDAIPRDSADHIAEFLEAEGIKGRRHAPCGCPLANYLTREVGEQVTVGGLAAYIYGSQARVWFQHSVTTFIHLVDNGHFPKLLEESVASK